jgi:hypothetical protein
MSAANKARREWRNPNDIMNYVVSYDSEGNPEYNTDADDNALATSGVGGKDKDKEKEMVTELSV